MLLLSTLILASAIFIIIWLRKKNQYWIERGVPQGKPVIFFGHQFKNILRQIAIPDLIQQWYNIDKDARYVRTLSYRIITNLNQNHTRTEVFLLCFLSSKSILCLFFLQVFISTILTIFFNCIMQTLFCIHTLSTKNSFHYYKNRNSKIDRIVKEKSKLQLESYSQKT